MPRPSPRLDSMARRLGVAYGILVRTFGARVRPVFGGVAFLGLRGALALAMPLDEVLFPSLRRARVQRPIVLVGNPRTGTTFLHRYLIDHGYGAGQQAFQMAWPSLTLQTLIRPVLPLVERASPTHLYDASAHETSPTAPETDDASLTLRYFDGFFLYGFLMAFHEEQLRPAFLPENRDYNDRDFAWLHAVWRRSLALHSDEVVVAKLFSLGARLPAFQRAFPGARVLYLARDPVAVIPSGLSLVTGVLDRVGGFWSLPEPVRARWIGRVYEALVDLLKRFTDDWNEGRIDRSGVLVVRYDRMMGEFAGVMREVHSFLDLDPTPAQAAAVDAVASAQRAYSSGHRYDLARFGLTEAQVRDDCRAFIETFLPEAP